VKLFLKRRYSLEGLEGLGSGEIKDILSVLLAEEDQKRRSYKEIKDRVEKMLISFLSSKYGVEKGDVVYHSDGKSKLEFQSFCLKTRDRDLDKRPFIFARVILPFGLAKPKKYHPQDWMTEEEFKKFIKD
jgi:hypothetical protein